MDTGTLGVCYLQPKSIHVYTCLISVSINNNILKNNNNTHVTLLSFTH